MFLEAKSYMAQETELLYVAILVISILVLHLIMTWTDSRRNGNSPGWITGPLDLDGWRLFRRPSPALAAAGSVENTRGKS